MQSPSLLLQMEPDISTAMHRLKLRSILQVGRSDGTGFCSAVGALVGDKVKFVELVAVEFVELVAVEFKVGFIVDDDIDRFLMDGDTDCIRVPDGEMVGTSEDTADELFEIVTLDSIDGTADGSISLGESVGHALPASPKRIICSKLVLPLLLPLGPAKAMALPS